MHIIPSAFNYFDDIKAKAFDVVDGLSKIGVEVEAFTLQYGGATKSVKEGVKRSSPRVHTYAGSTNADGLAQGLEGFDIVHLHCPFLGAANHLVQWKKTHQNIPLLITYYRDVRFIDFFSLFIKIYNAIYLPKLFKLADMVVCQNFDDFRVGRGVKYMTEDKKIIALDEVSIDESLGVFSGNESLAARMLLVYNNLV